MKTSRTNQQPILSSTRFLTVLIVATLAIAFATSSAFMQEDAIQSTPTALADRISLKSDRVAPKNKDGNPQVESAPIFSPDLITAGTYAFAVGASALRDMSSGTTTLVGPDLDDNASAVADIGFDFWYDGVRYTQFSCNANGLCRLGGTAISTSFDNSTAFASTTNAPKIAPYFDNLWIGTNGKVHYKVSNVAPNRELTVEWQNMQIPRVGPGATGAGTFQMSLVESAAPVIPGAILFFYGTGLGLNSAEGGYSIGLQSGGATNFASVTTTGDTVSYAVANNTQTNAITATKIYRFAPNVPAAPTGLNFTAVTATSMTVNWTDNATNEVGYVIYRSTDGVNFTFLTQLAAGATSFPDSGLNPSTPYFYQVYAVTEGALSTPALASSQATSAAGNITSIASGNWSAGATWSGGVPPTSNDNVTIANGHLVIIDSSAALNVTVNFGGTLQYEAVTSRTLTVGQSVTVDSGGVFQNGGIGLAHSLVVGQNLTNNGFFSFSNGGSGAGITFTGAANNTFSGTGTTTKVHTITINKGTSNANILELTTTNFTVQGSADDLAGFLTLTNGTLKISGTFTMTNRIFTTANYLIPATGGIWLNNPNFTVVAQAGGETSANNGLFRMTQGVYNIGLTGADGFGGGAGAVFIVEGGIINATRIDPQSAVTFTITGGTINVSPTTANTRSNFASFELFDTASTFTMSGGTINLIQAAVAATPIDYQVLPIPNITGGTLNVGTAATATNFNFRIRGNAPALVVDNTTNNKTATSTAQTIISGPVLVNTGTTYDLNGFLVAFTGDFTNNGTVTGTTTGSRVYFLGGTPAAAQVYMGSGVVTVPIFDITIDNPLGVTFDPPAANITTLRVGMLRGNVTNSNELTLGNAGVTTGLIQFGQDGSTVAAGSFDVAPVFNLGTGGQIILYEQEGAMRTTGNEINPTRILDSMLVDNTNHVTLTGGNLALSDTAFALNLANGRFITGANTLSLSSGTATLTRTNGMVDGNFRKTYTAAGSKSFEVGTANGFSPVTVNVTAGTFPSDFTVKATQGPHPNVNPATSVQRYWTLTEAGDVTATLNFQYLLGDVLGTEANYRVIRVIGGTSVSFPGSTVDLVNHRVGVGGVSNFSDWTVGENSAPTAAPASISGRVTSNSGAPLAGVTMYLSGARSARVVSDSNGNYRFTNVDTDNFYTVTPAILNHHFSPASRSFSLLANMTDAMFTGTLDDVITGNVIDTPEYFVRQHYLDFLGREPDDAGLIFWSEQMRGCGNDFNCLERRTINVSAAYFLSIEFQETGGLVDGLYRASYGRAPLYAEFVPDSATVAEGVIVNQTGWEDLLAANKQEFLDAWVERPAFHAAYDNLGNDGYVDTLISHTGVDFTAAERAALVGGLTDGSLTRAQVLGRVAQNERFVTAKFNEAFVRMQYFGYLRRDPDDSGFHFWLNKLNEFEGNFERAEMVKAFLVSGEYRGRFR